MSWQPMNTAPKHQGAQVLAWFPKVKLDEDDNPTTEVIGGAMAQIERQGDAWTEPEWLSAHGSYWMEDWCFADAPVLWHPLPPEPVGPIGVRAVAPDLMQRVIAHLESQALYTPSERNREALQQLLTELRAASGVLGTLNTEEKKHG